MNIEFFIACTLLGLEYIHQEQILHRDIKPENLVLDQKGYVHITDFGIAKKYQPNNARDTSGTIGYMAPEVLNNESHGYSVDFYAIGIITYEFLFGHRPYLAKSKRELKELILTRQAQVDVDELPSGWSPDAADFINQLIQRKPKNRLGLQSIDEVKTHPWFYNYDWERLEKRTTRALLIPKKGDNFDRKYCSAPDKIGNDTMERYKQYMMDGSYEERFKHFSSDVIPDELKRTYNILGSQSLYNLSDISTNMNSHHTLNVNNSLQKTSRNKNDNNQNNSKHLSVGSINVGSSSKELVHVNKNESKPKENLPNNIMNDMFRKIDSRLRMSRQKEKRSPVNNPSHNGNNNVLKNSAIFLGSNKLKKSTSINKEEKSLSSSNSFKLIRNASQSKLVLEKKLPIINLSFTKKKNNSFKQDFSFSQLYPAPQFSDKRTSSRGKLRNKFFNLNHYYHNNSHIGSNNIINNSLNKSMYNGYNMNSGKQTNRSMSSLNYYGK